MISNINYFWLIILGLTLKKGLCCSVWTPHGCNVLLNMYQTTLTRTFIIVSKFNKKLCQKLQFLSMINIKIDYNWHQLHQISIKYLIEFNSIKKQKRDLFEQKYIVKSTNHFHFLSYLITMNLNYLYFHFSVIAS